MKAFKLVAIFCVVALFFTACQKEIVFSTNGISVGTLKEATTGNCLPSTVNGVYQKDTAITAENFIDVNVDVTSVGTYSIQTDTVNGVSFKGTGTFGAKGNNRVRLYGHGKPTATGISTFTVVYGASICTIDVTVIGSGGGNAIYTLGGAGSTCSGFTLGAGTYNAGQILVAGNTVTLNVSVLAVGTYNLTTDTINGYWFNASGTFTNATVQSLTLNGHGTPGVNQTNNFTLSNGSTTCKFTIVVGGGTPAVFTLASGAGGACSVANVHGTYTVGTALSAANNVDVQVNVTTAGSYSFSTNTVNGIKFTASGTFTGTGVQTVNMVAAAGSNPTTQGVNTITPQVGTSTCTFDITVMPASTVPADAKYSFVVNGITYQGPLVGTVLNTPTPPEEEQDATDPTNPGNVFNIYFNNATGPITAGDYSGSSVLGKYFTIEYAGTTLQFGASPAFFGLTDLPAKITSINTTTHAVTGTFQGTALDASVNAITVTNGTFKFYY
jgi:hypothetical protein